MGLVIGSLVFWKPAAGAAPRSPAKVDDALRKAKPPAGLADLPVDAIVKSLKKQYPGMEWADHFAEVDLDDVEAGVELTWNRKHFRFDFYGNGFPQMDAVAALMAKHGCWCYYPDDKSVSPPDAPPKFTDPEFDEKMDKLTDALVKHAWAGGDKDPQARLKRALDLMNSGKLDGLLAMPPAADATGKQKKQQQQKKRRKP